MAGLCACNRRPPAVRVVTTPDYDKGVSFLERRNDSAYFYFNKVVTSSKDSLQLAMAYNNMAVIENDEGDDYGGQEMALTSLRYLHEDRAKDQYCLVADYNVLGNSSLNLKNYDAAIRYYDQAATLTKSEAFRNIALNNKAVVYREEKQYDRAIALYDSILVRSKLSKKEYARVLTNLAMVRWLKDTTYRAAPSLLMALQLREAEKDDWGLNSSYNHLAEYYSSSRPDSAFRYAREMLVVAMRLGSPDDELEALQRLITLGPAAAVKPWFARYRTLNDSLQLARSRAKNQFALIRYESEKNRTDNLRLQRENAEKRIELLWGRILLFGSIAVFGLVVAWLVVWFRKRTRNRIRDHQLRTSQKVHDVVANGLYRLLSGLEHDVIVDKERLLDELEILYEQSRDISYERIDDGEAFHLVVTQLLTSFGGPETKVGVAGNGEALWTSVGLGVKRELEPILQELMINMKKHSGAGKASVQFHQDDGQLVVRYADDGAGLPPAFRYGNGLANTENRIQKMGGQLIFGPNNPKGLKIEIRIPII